MKSNLHLLQWFQKTYSIIKFSNYRLSGFFNFMRPTYILRDPEIYKQICTKNFDSFVDHLFVIEPHMDTLMGNTLFLMRGEKWRAMRTTLTPAFTSAKMRHMFDLVRDCAINSTDFLLATFFPTVGCEMEMELKVCLLFTYRRKKF